MNPLEYQGRLADNGMSIDDAVDVGACTLCDRKPEGRPARMLTIKRSVGPGPRTVICARCLDILTNRLDEG